VIAGLAVSVALLVPLAVFGAPALARSTAAASQYEYSGSAQYQYRVELCHLTGSRKHPGHTITVSSAAVAAHVRHGDHLGACTGNESPRPKHHDDEDAGSSTSTTSTSTTATTVTPGQNEHGNWNGQGHGHGNGKGHDGG
jgi:hypothetical protein